MGDERDESAGTDDHRGLLGGIAAGSAIVFTVTVVFVVVAQTLAPVLGVQAGAPSDTVLVTMIISATAGGGSLLAKEFLRRRNGG